MNTETLTVADEHQRAANEAERLSTGNNTPAPEDRGIHRTREDVMEAELRAAGWTPTAVHPRSPVWRSPDGVLMPFGYAHSVMKGLIKV